MLDVHFVATRAGVGRLEDGGVALLDTAFPHAGAALEQEGSLAVLAAASVLSWVALADCELLAPVGTPRAVWGVGLNYRSKARRAGRPAPSEPILYLAAPSSVVGPGTAVALPDGQAHEVDYEGEIAVVIGRRLFDAGADESWAAVAGVTAANDITARDVMRSTATPTLAKSFPGFTPMGASFLTADELPDPEAIDVRTWLNGVLVQHDDSGGMIFSIADLLARLSRYVALEPGDVVLTGTPAGTGQDRGCFLAAGDEVRVQVASALPLVTTVTAPAARDAAGSLLAGRAG